MFCTARIQSQPLRAVLFSRGLGLRDDEIRVGKICGETALQSAHSDFDGKLSVWRRELKDFNVGTVCK